MRRTYTMANTNPYTSTRICKDCGKVMTNVSNTKLYCPECAKKRHDEQTAAWWAKKKCGDPHAVPEERKPGSPHQERREAGCRVPGRLPGSGCRRSELRTVYAAESKQKARRCSNTDEP